MNTWYTGIGSGLGHSNPRNNQMSATRRPGCSGKNLEVI